MVIISFLFSGLFGLFSTRESQPRGCLTSCLPSSSWETPCTASVSCWRTPTTAWARRATSCTTCRGWWAAWGPWRSTSSYPFRRWASVLAFSPTYMLHAELMQTAPCERPRGIRYAASRLQTGGKRGWAGSSILKLSSPQHTRPPHPRRESQPSLIASICDVTRGNQYFFGSK